MTSELVSPQGNVRYNAEFVCGDVSRLEHGKTYSAVDLVESCGSALFLRDSAQAVEKNVKKWRFERG